LLSPAAVHISHKQLLVVGAVVTFGSRARKGRAAARARRAPASRARAPTADRAPSFATRTERSVIASAPPLADFWHMTGKGVLVGSTYTYCTNSAWEVKSMSIQ
jgi:hypothetical protein